jgi:centrosomal CEP192-like protein
MTSGKQHQIPQLSSGTRRCEEERFMKTKISKILVDVALLTMSVLAVGPKPALPCSTRCGPGLSVSPSSLSFPAQVVGTRSASMAITLKNWGNLPVAFSGISSSGPPFTQSNTCPHYLQKFQTCHIYVTFAPTQVGTFHGVITIRDNMPSGEQQVTLSGVGVRAP